MRTVTWLWIWGLLCCALASTATAQEDGAREHFRRGEAAYQKGNYALAISEWETAYSQDPRPRIQFNIYQAHERLGQLPQAVEALQKYLSSADPDDPYYADATARMAALQQRLQATGIRLMGGIDGASISISGHNWGRLPRPDKVPVQPGNHRVVIQLDGYQDFVANVVVPAGQVVEVAVALVALEGDAPESTGIPASGSVQIDTGGSGDGTPFYVAAAVLGAGALGSGIWALNRSSELDGCDDPDFFCTEESAVETQRNIGFALTGVLAAGALGSLIYGIIVDGDSGEAASAMCAPVGLGANCQVRF
ncbi:MAG: PEGA domain-containing protein [Myxococcales bacterium]|nr:PEGA domain-containing protein [Myxococcales bacterium]